MQNTVVAHFRDGTLVKGVTNNFFPNKPGFHVVEHDSGARREIATTDLKAIFFVKDFAGDAERDERSDIERTGFGKKMRVEFEDGETLVGYCQGYSPDRPGFFLFPADPGSNNDRIFVVTAATRSAAFI
jgi:hypothetical protein